jgi:hypothetical protein
MIQLNPRFKTGGTVGQLVQSGDLAPGMEKIFRSAEGPSSSGDPSLQLHQHQLDAITLANQGKSVVVTTGTGSGKSLCFFIPIIDQILRAKAKGEPQRTRAIVVYPMNALANSQLEELDKRTRDQTTRSSAVAPISVSSSTMGTMSSMRRWAEARRSIALDMATPQAAGQVGERHQRTRPVR